MSIQLKVGYQVSLGAMDFTRSDALVAPGQDKIAQRASHGHQGEVSIPDASKVTWSSSDATKATVDSKGVVVGIAVATVTITATYRSMTATFTVAVVAGNVEGIVVYPKSLPVPKISYTPGDYDSNDD